MNIEELERRRQRRIDDNRAIGSVSIEWADFERILARLKAAEEWYEAYKEFLRVDRSEPDLAKWDAATVRLEAAEAALIAVHEEDGNEADGKS